MYDFLDEDEEDLNVMITILPEEVLEKRSYTQEYFEEIFRIRQSYFVYLLCLPNSEFYEAYEKILKRGEYLGVETSNYYFVTNKEEILYSEYALCQNNIKTAWDLIDQVKRGKLRYEENDTDEDWKFYDKESYSLIEQLSQIQCDDSEE